MLPLRCVYAFVCVYLAVTRRAGDTPGALPRLRLLPFVPPPTTWICPVFAFVSSCWFLRCTAVLRGRCRVTALLPLRWVAAPHPNVRLTTFRTPRNAPHAHFTNRIYAHTTNKTTHAPVCQFSLPYFAPPTRIFYVCRSFRCASRWTTFHCYCRVSSLPWTPDVHPTWLCHTATHPCRTSRYRSLSRLPYRSAVDIRHWTLHFPAFADTYATQRLLGFMCLASLVD